MLDRVLALNRALRASGVPVSLSESIDAMRALQEIDVTDKQAFKSALATATIKEQSGLELFDVLFEIYFGARRLPEGDTDADESSESMQQEVAAAVGGTGQGLGELARRAVEAFGRVGSERGWYSSYETTRTLDLDTLLRRLLREADESEAPPYEKAMRRAEIEGHMRTLRREILAESRRRVAEQRGPDAVAAYASEPRLEDRSFLSMPADLDELRRAVRPLARKLATRIAAKRRRGRRGQLDIRRTVRHALQTGGVPFKPAFRHRVPHRPELFLLCDVSGSVARFARFSLMLTHALSAQFQKVRSFAFVDALDEVTRSFSNEDFGAALEQMSETAQVVSADGHSDYGASFEQFLETYGSDVGPKTTLLILGDARTNYRPSRAEVLKDLAARARHSYWLNPEPRGDWDSGDSVATNYAECVDAMVEVRNLRQLEDFIANRL